MTEEKNKYDVIIVGGSYAGLSAAMSLGRSLRRVLVIDSGLPCNRQTPFSHNLITHDGTPPAAIAAKAKEQVAAYNTVSFYNGLALTGRQVDGGFEIATQQGDVFEATKLVLATGVKDILPEVEGFSECWGISILHCPYCHGYEVKMEETGIWANGEFAYAKAQMISNWTDKLTIFTNGQPTFSEEQLAALERHSINIEPRKVTAIHHQDGYVTELLFADGSTKLLKALYAKPETVQHCPIPEQLGCALTDDGLIAVDAMQQTSVAGVYACGDSANWARAVALAISTGVTAGTALNREMIVAQF